jgi:thioredoxin
MKQMAWARFSFLLWFLFTACDHTSSQAGEEQTVLPASTFDQKLHELKEVQLVDVRTPEEFNGGYIKGAVNMNFNADDFAANIERLDKEKPVMVYCKAGGRSARAAEQLKKAGFKKIYDLDGGIMAWENAKLPLENQAPVSPTANRFTPGDFDLLLSGKELMLVDFYANWCEPCKRMEPVLQKLAETYKGKVEIVRINVDEAVDLSKKINIEGLPVVCTYKKGTEVKRVRGEQTEKDLDAMIRELLQ